LVKHVHAFGRLKNGLRESYTLIALFSCVISALYANDRRASVLSRLISQCASRVSGNIRPESAARISTALQYSRWLHYANVCVCGVQECNYLPSRHTVAFVSRTKPTAVARINATAAASYATSDTASSSATTQHGMFKPPPALYFDEQ